MKNNPLDKFKSQLIRLIKEELEGGEDENRYRNELRGIPIKKGDTLSAIARKHGTTVSKLKAANGMSSDSIREGKSLKIPK